MVLLYSRCNQIIIRESYISTSSCLHNIVITIYSSRHRVLAAKIDTRYAYNLYIGPDLKLILMNFIWNQYGPIWYNQLMLRQCLTWLCFCLGQLWGSHWSIKNINEISILRMSIRISILKMGIMYKKNCES